MSNRSFSHFLGHYQFLTPKFTSQLKGRNMAGMLHSRETSMKNIYIVISQKNLQFFKITFFTESVTIFLFSTDCERQGNILYGHVQFLNVVLLNQGVRCTLIHLNLYWVYQERPSVITECILQGIGQSLLLPPLCLPSVSIFKLGS